MMLWRSPSVRFPVRVVRPNNDSTELHLSGTIVITSVVTEKAKKASAGEQLPLEIVLTALCLPKRKCHGKCVLGFCEKQYFEEMEYTTENDVYKNQSSADSAIRFPNTSTLNSNAAI
ncbi:hypothetical protein TNCV_1247521 [Trichonephila clavipes]|nr:hypothetical protein TNCV_1247521 [Trichonephila clavipes]